MKANAWTSEELALLVAVYFQMLEKEQAGLPYSKAEHNRALQAKIARSHGSIEMKWMNVSAVLSERGLAFVKGYKPYPNYQAALKDVVLAKIAPAQAVA